MIQYTINDPILSQEPPLKGCSEHKFSQRIFQKQHFPDTYLLFVLRSSQGMDSTPPPVTNRVKNLINFYCLTHIVKKVRCRTLRIRDSNWILFTKPLFEICNLLIKILEKCFPYKLGLPKNG